MQSSSIQSQIIIDGKLPDTGGPVILQIVNNNKRSSCCGIIHHYKVPPGAAFAGIQIFLAVASIIVNALAIHHELHWYYRQRIYNDHNYEFNNYEDLAHVGYGFWTVIMWFLAGAFGLSAACGKRKCLIMTYMVMSIIAAATLTWYLPLTWAQIAEDRKEYAFRVNDLNDMTAECLYYDTPTTTDVHGYRTYRNFGSKTDCEKYIEESLSNIKNDYSIRLPMDVLMVLIGLAELVASVGGAVICCKATCNNSCCSNPGDTEISGGTTSQVRYVVNQGNLQMAQQGSSGTPLLSQEPVAAQPMGQQHFAGMASTMTQDVSVPPQYSSDMPPAYTK